MPELPEVETVCQGLRDSFGGSQPVIDSIKIYRRDLRESIPTNFAKNLSGQKIIGVRRRAKFILIDTNKFTIISHLGMSGSWRFITPPFEKTERRMHDHCLIKLSNNMALTYHDPRRFGILTLSPIGEEHKSKWLNHLGVEPLSKEFTADYLLQLTKGKTRSVKNVLMDQEVVVGVGNIYVAEILFCAGVSPFRESGKVSRAEWGEIAFHTRRILRGAIKSKGTTIRDYVQSTGESGNFAQSLKVYGRGGMPCRNCSNKVLLKMQNNRSSYWCEHCQK